MHCLRTVPSGQVAGIIYLGLGELASVHAGRLTFLSLVKDFATIFMIIVPNYIRTLFILK